MIAPVCCRYNMHVFHIGQDMCRMGCPETFITDQGREFVNELSSSLYTLTNTGKLPVKEISSTSGNVIV